MLLINPGHIPALFNYMLSFINSTCQVKLERYIFLKRYQNASESAVSEMWISDLCEKKCGTVEKALLDLELEDSGVDHGCSTY